MKLLRRPWASPEEISADMVPLGPKDCFLREEPVANHAQPLGSVATGINRALELLRYPKLGHAEGPPAIKGLPYRPKANTEPKTEKEKEAAAALGRMNRVVARLQELETALDDPENVWNRLADAWHRAENEQDPRMAEIVRQARDIRPRLQFLEKRIRRVLRRALELAPLDRAQEMGRASMLWLIKQPGRNTAEQAGSRQRVLATVRHENFDTLENRVLHAYVTLAAGVARKWNLEHRAAENSDRFLAVNDYRKHCRRLIQVFADLGVGHAIPGITPNYVLMDDRDYRVVYKAWIKLVRRERAIDDLWAWQAQSWANFCILALILSIHALDDTELITQSPIIWNDEAVKGRLFEQGNPLAVFWFQKSGRVVEVNLRPERISLRKAIVLAHIWLKISDISGIQVPRHIPVWTLHCFIPHKVEIEVQQSVSKLQEAQRTPGSDIVQEGLILMQAFGDHQVKNSTSGCCTVQGISLDAAGASLAYGMNALSTFVQDLVLETSS